MKIIIKFTKLDSTPAIIDYVEKKIGSLAKFIKHWEEKGVVEAQVELARRTLHHQKGEVMKAEVNLHLPGRMLRAKWTGEDIRIGIDRVRDMLQNDIRKYKDIRGREREVRKARRTSRES